MTVNILSPLGLPMHKCGSRLLSSVPTLEEAKDIAEKLIELPNIASKRWVWEQYDSMVGTLNRGTNRPSDAGVVSVRGTKKALA